MSPISLPLALRRGGTLLARRAVNADVHNGISKRCVSIAFHGHGRALGAQWEGRRAAASIGGARSAATAAAQGAERIGEKTGTEIKRDRQVKDLAADGAKQEVEGTAGAATLEQTLQASVTAAEPHPPAPDAPAAVGVPTATVSTSPSPAPIASSAPSSPQSSASPPASLFALPFHQRLGPLTIVINAFSNNQRRRPLLTQFFTALVIYMLGDLSAQSLGGAWDEDGEGWDAARTGRNLVVGGVAAIPVYKWFLLLSRHPLLNYRSKPLSILSKVLTNQLLFAPTINTYYFSFSALLSGASPSDILERVKTAVPVSIYTSVKVWPAVMTLNFWLVPMEFRAVFAGTVQVGWQGYLSWLNRRAEMEKREKGEARN